jgi:copper chaperone NosL
MPDPTPCDCDGHAHSVTRRAVLATGASVATAALAGCSGEQQPTETPDPVALAAGDQCDICGMVIPDHPGPNGELFYAERTPSGHADPARFDSLRGCLFPFHFEHQRRDWNATAVYVTDYSTVDYTLSTEGSETFISSHVGADSFTDGQTAFYVIGSEVRGAMGADFVPFSVRDDADAFAADHGGEVLAFDDITPETLER